MQGSTSSNLDKPNSEQEVIGNVSRSNIPQNQNNTSSNSHSNNNFDFLSFISSFNEEKTQAVTPSSTPKPQ